MPTRATKRGAQRTALHGTFDLVICGASFAGLTVAREVAKTNAKILLIDRYEIGERQTSACAAPTQWLTDLQLEQAIQQTFDTLTIHTPVRTFSWRLPWTFSTFDYQRVCQLLYEQSNVNFETAKVDGIDRDSDADFYTIITDRGNLNTPLAVDALGWRRVLGTGKRIQPPKAYMSRGLEVHPNGSGDKLEIWLDPDYIRAGYAWSFPADKELRVGVGSFDPYDHVKQPTVKLADALDVPAKRWQGNWIPHKLREAVDDGVFFVGDSAGHCFPLTAEGIRPAFYFALACGRELTHVLEGKQTRGQALDRYGHFSAQHSWQYRWLLRTQQLVGKVNKYPLMNSSLELMNSQAFIDWSFRNYFDITPPPSSVSS